MNDREQRAENVAKARAMLENFSPMDQGWCDVLADEIVMEFPFGADVGLPPKVEGKPACVGLFRAVYNTLNLAFSDVAVHAMDDPNLVLAEYKGAGAFKGKPYNQSYITLLEFADGKLRRYREHVDTKVVADVLGHLSALQ